MLILHNAKFYIDGSYENDILAIGIEAGKIVALYTQLPHDFSWRESKDLKGAFVYPGFIDTHTHSFEGGLYRGGVDLSHHKSISAVLDAIADAVKELGKDEMLFTWRFDENNIAERRFPSVKELDGVCPSHRMILRRVDGHSCVVNSFARNQIGALSAREEILRGADNDIAGHWFHGNCSKDTILKAYHNAAEAALKGGFTTIHTMIGDANNSITHYPLIAKHVQDFAVEYVLYPQSFNLNAALDAGATRIGGCILADGSIGSMSAALSFPYERTACRGVLYHDDNFWRDFITQAHRHKLQVAIHCIGDAAIRQINNIFYQLANDDYADLRHQLIHCEITPDDLIHQIKASQAVPVMQPAFDLLWGGDNGFYCEKLGVERSRMMNRLGTMNRLGIRLTGSSDWYVTELDIPMSIHAAINHKNPSERLSPADAISIYTKNAAWLSHDETRLGSIQPGFQADLTIADTDFTKAFDHHHCNIIGVIKKGLTVYETSV
ncbi:MAG: amidohydrolase family protein [Candidatus Cloacimonadaceae bacterium]|nr:amidohydrolase family protein [Candidatus Cloacimonadaceae bacterium]MDP3115256.1 amidohydrolase family protein [Candidatus Cloacimonadaceae bacterium]